MPTALTIAGSDSSGGAGIQADLKIDTTKIGMLATAAIVEAVAAAIEELELPMVVVDPVLVSSSGERLLDADGVQTLISELLPLARAVTPNIPEAEALSGCRISSANDARKAASRIREMGAATVIITGGHGSGTEVIDFLCDHDDFTELRVPRIGGGHVHGTGCAYASALAAGLALGQSLPESARHAQAYVAGAMKHALKVGRGAGLLDHFWQRKSG